MELGKLTEEDMITHPMQHVLYQVLGREMDIKIDTTTETLQLNDLIILCSDGLWEMLDIDHTIKQVSSTPNLSDMVKQLINMAKQAGSSDDMSVIIIRISAKDAGFKQVLKRLKIFIEGLYK